MGRQTASLRNLPVELLTRIMKDVKEQEGQKWSGLLQVCRDWHAIATSNPMFWTRARVKRDANLYWLQVSLERSKAMPFQLTVASPLHIVPAIQLVAPHVARLHKIYLHPPYKGSSIDAMQNLLHTKLPSLKVLHINVRTVDDNVADVPVKLSQENFPRLEELSVSFVHISPDSTALASLRKLHIDELVGHPGLHVHQLATLLRRCVRLEDLYMHAMGVPDRFEEHASNNIPTVVLPNLRTVKLVDDWASLRHLLTFLEIPATANVTIGRVLLNGTQELDFANGIRDALPAPNRRGRLPILSRIKSAQVTLYQDFEWNELNPGWMTMTGRMPGSGVINLSLEANPLEEFACLYGWPSHDLTDLTDIFGDAPLQELTVRIIPEKVAEINWEAVFRSFPNLSSFTVEASYPDDYKGDRTTAEDEYVVIEDLNPGIANGSGVVCTGLRRLKLSGFVASNEFLDELQQCLKERSRALGLKASTLASLTLDLKGADDVDYSTMNRLLGSLVENLEFVVDGHQLPGCTQ